MTTTAEPPAPTRTNGKQRSGTPVRASAKRLQNADAKVGRTRLGRGEDWQTEAWEYFDDIGMVKQVIYFRGNQMAKFRVFAAVRPADDPEGTPIPVSDPDSGVPPDVATRAQNEVQRVKPASGGTSEVLRLLDMNNEVAGESWIVGRGPSLRTEKDGETGDSVEVLTLESWEVRSILEVRKKDDHWEVQNADTGSWERLDLDNADVLVRVWQRHPAKAMAADCHMRAILTDCEALVLLTNEVKAESKSRQNNGLLFMPNTMTITSAPTTTTPANQDTDPDAIDDLPDDDTDPPITTIAHALGESMLDPISDPSSPWSVEPRIISGPAEDGQHIRYIELNRKASDRLEERIAARKEAIAQGLNAPIEVAKGHMDTTFANASQIDEDIYEKHLQPSAVLFCDMWTIGLLRPALLEAGVTPDMAERIIVWYDPSDVLSSVDPSEKVAEAVALDLISDEAARRYWNFTDDDAPPPIDRLIRAILKQRTWDPGLVDAVVAALDPTLDIPDPPNQVLPNEPGQAPPLPAPQMAQLRDDLARLRAEGLGATADTLDSAVRSRVLAALLDLRQQPAVRASAKPDRSPRAQGERLAAGDRTLMTRTVPMLSSAMTRALERAGNRLKAQTQHSALGATLRTVHPLYAARQIGPAQLAAFDVDPTALVDDDAFDREVNQYHTWAKHWQHTALGIAAGLGALSATQRQRLAEQQDADLADSAAWMNDQLHDLAQERLFDPDPTAPTRGEFDPTSRVPMGLVRTALAIAGGATALEFARSNERDKFAATSPSGTPGGIGTGQLITNAITETGTVTIEGWQWDYGDGYRANPYEPHEDLDGDVAESKLDFGEDDFGLAEPGNHDGCQCGPLIPVYAEVSVGEGPAPIEADVLGEGD